MPETTARTASLRTRALILVLAAWLIWYGLDGLLRDDIFLPCKWSCEGTHYHGTLAWLVFGGIISFAAGVICATFITFDGRKRMLQFVPVVLIIAAFALGIRAKLLVDRGSDDYVRMIQRGETLYTTGKYFEAQKMFYGALLAARDHTRLAEHAAARGADSFCTGLFRSARAELALKNEDMALLDIDTALAEGACTKFAADIKWAREQKAALKRNRP